MRALLVAGAATLLGACWPGPFVQPSRSEQRSPGPRSECSETRTSRFGSTGLSWRRGFAVRWRWSARGGVLVASDRSVYLLNAYERGLPALGGRVLRPAGVGGMFVARLSGAGEPEWVMPLPEAQAATMALGGDGGVVVAGAQAPQAPGATGAPGGAAPRRSALLVLRLASDGTVRWSRRLGSGEELAPRAVTVDGAGRISLAVRATGGARLDGAAPDQALLRQGLVRLAADGRLLWARELPTVLEVQGLAAGEGETLLVAGCRPREAIAFGHDDRQRPVELGPVTNSSLSTAAFVVSLDGRGQPRWARDLELGQQCAVAVAPGAGGGAMVVAAADEEQQAPVSRGVRVDYVTRTVVASLDGGGQLRWRHCFTTPHGQDHQLSIATADGTTWVAGSYQDGFSAVDRGGPIFAVRFDAGGRLERSRYHRRGGSFAPGAVAVSPAGRVAAAGAEGDQLGLACFGD